MFVSNVKYLRLNLLFHLVKTFYVMMLENMRYFLVATIATFQNYKRNKETLFL